MPANSSKSTAKINPLLSATARFATIVLLTIASACDILFLLQKEKPMKRKLWNKNFTLLIQGNAVSTIGDVMYGIAIGYWVYQATGSSALMGVMTSISMFVTMFLSPFCGGIVDKCNRKSLIVAIDLIQGFVMLTVGVLAYLNALSVPIVLVAALLASIGSVFYSPAISTILLDIIPRDELVRGESVYSSINSTINLVGSALSGVMVLALGVPLIVVINGASNLYSAITEMFVKVPKSTQQNQPVTVKGLFNDFSMSVKTVFSDGCLKIFVPCALIVNLLAAGPLSLLLPFCMEREFHVDFYGYIVACWSLSCLVAALMLGIFKFKPKTQYWLMTLGFVLTTPFMVSAFLAPNGILACVFAFVAGFFNCIGNSIFNASMMLALPKENRNAILGVFNSASVGGTALSTVIYGLLGEFFPLHIVFSVGTSLALPIMIFMCFHPRIKRFVQDPPPDEDKTEEQLPPSETQQQTA